MYDNRKTLTDSLRQLTETPLNRLGKILAGLGVHPDLITVLGLVLVAIASFFLAAGDFLGGGILLACSLPLDALDGAVARAMHRRGFFGMVLDSTLDRYADGFIFAALGYHFARQDRMEMLALSLLALIGSYLVSYVRARADDSKVAVRTTVGWFTRLERIAVILLMTLTSGIFNEEIFLEIGLLVLAIGTNLTALQRLHYVYAALKDRGE